MTARPCIRVRGLGTEVTLPLKMVWVRMWAVRVKLLVRLQSVAMEWDE